MASRPPTTQEIIAALEAELAESSARYEALLRRSRNARFRSTPDGRFLEVSPAVVSMLGYDSADEVLALDIASEVYLDPHERARLMSAPTAQDGTDWLDTRWKRKDGTPIDVRLSAHQVLDDAGEVVSYDALVEDVTERRRMEEQSRQQQQMASVGATLAGVAHELNNPLAAILGFAQLLLRSDYPASVEERSALEAIHHEALRSASIVKNLLMLATRRIGERRALTNVNDLAEYVVRTREHSLATVGITCRLESAGEPSMVMGDRGQLEQVLINLITNAEQALRSSDADDGRVAGATITVRTRHDERSVIVEVEDNGPGVPAEAASEIWNPFFTTKPDGQGTGLGLTVAQGVVVDHGGSIMLERPDAAGARFIVRLPRSTDAGAPGVVRPLDVLVVDPAAADLHFVERFLTSRGHAVINADSAEAALRLAGQTTFDVVVCDDALAADDGVTLADALRGAQGCRDARFILSSPVLDGIDRGDSVADGVARVGRPYDVEELRRLIEDE